MAVDTVKCGNCGHENPKDEDFCQECGQPLTRSGGEEVREEIEAQEEVGTLGVDRPDRDGQDPFGDSGPTAEELPRRFS